MRASDPAQRRLASTEFSMTGKSAVTALVAGLMFASATQAGQVAQAQIASVSGAVIAIQAKGTAPAKAGTALMLGDRVVAQTGQAGLRYADGCTVTVKAGSMATISPISPCASGAGLVSATTAQPDQLSKKLSHLSVGTILAGAGTVLLLGAVVDGVINGDTRCDTFVDATCNGTVSP
jgi:hypothetical protein